jgi:tRNA-specific 2-thiouridylase
MKKTLTKQTLTLNPSPRGRGKSRVLIALSGGIDSAVSAYLLIKQGYEVEAAFMKNWSSTAGLLKNECPWLVDRQDALRVAAYLRIPVHTLDFEKQYQKTVMKYFFDEYKKGRTPNPDVMCNKEIKFKLLYNWARKNGFDYLATGHYARIYTTPSQQVGTPLLGRRGGSADVLGGSAELSSFLRRSTRRQAGEVVGVKYSLMRSKDEFKDQTYFIYNIKTEQLPHILFPIGGMKKTAVRSLARKLKLPNAEKKESMGLCFVGKIRLKDFLKQKLKVKPGLIVLLPPLTPPLQGGGSAVIPPLAKGRLGGVIGKHQGLFNFTIGQRQGIKAGGTGPYYVVKKDLKKNILYVTKNPDDKSLMTKEIQIHSINELISLSAYKHVSLLGRFRHQGELVPLTVSKIKNGLYRVIFNKPQKAVASGQSLVFYRDKECVGGGIIG